MKKLLVKSVLLGFIMHVTVFAASGIICGLTTPPTISDVDLMAAAITTSLFAWYGAAVILLVPLARFNKTTMRATIARAVFIWAPISLGWFIVVETGVTFWFTLGMLLSSIFLCYEVSVLRMRKKLGKG